MLRSYLSKEQLETPALKFFHENLPNVTVTRNEKYQVFELQWKNREDYLLENPGGCKFARASISNALNMPAMCGLQFSVNSGWDIIFYVVFSFLRILICFFLLYDFGSEEEPPRDCKPSDA